MKSVKPSRMGLSIGRNLTPEKKLLVDLGKTAVAITCTERALESLDFKCSVCWTAKRLLFPGELSQFL
jgi:hypothetical protein